MAKEEYTPKNFGAAALAIIDHAEDLFDDYEAQGLTLSLRQLYYRLVAADIIPNNQKEYKRLGNIIADARLAGMLDWDLMEDRTRPHHRHNSWCDPAEMLSTAAGWYAEDLWADQEFMPEVWVEKDALIGVISTACDPLMVPYFSSRGHGSLSAMYEAGERMKRYMAEGKYPIIFCMTDHDPSGLDIARDVQAKMDLFCERDSVDVQRIALTREQIDHYTPPPNPVKFSDSRATGYEALHGQECWELDALEPPILIDLIQGKIKGVTDELLWDGAVEQQEEARKRLQELAAEEGSG